MKVRSLKTHPYGGQYRPKGSTYDISKMSDIKLLIAIKKIEYITDEAEPESQKMVHVETDSSDTDKAGDEKLNPKKQKRKYERKDSASYSRKDMVPKSLTSD